MDSVYSSYASALLSVAKEEQKVIEYKLSLIEVDDYLNTHEEVKTYLESYFIDFDSKCEVIDLLTKGFKLDNLSNFLKVLVKKHRLNILKRIAKEFIEISNEELRILEGIVYSTIPLSKEEISKLEKAIKAKLSQDVELVNKIDESLIGGVKIAISDHVFDGSIKGKLESLKLNLKERRN